MPSDSPITFISQSMKNFRTIGSLAPSSGFLARACANAIPKVTPPDFRAIEVGSGTGAISRWLAIRMKAGEGHLDLCELTPKFCQVLKDLIAKDKAFTSMHGRVHLCEGNILEMNTPKRYDVIVSGLPFSCFDPHEVQAFIEHYKVILKPGGVLLWYEYLAIGELQSPFVGKANRQRLKGVEAVKKKFWQLHQIKQDFVPINIPPARVRHLRFG